jgi:hypothetical protein
MSGHTKSRRYSLGKIRKKLTELKKHTAAHTEAASIFMVCDKLEQGKTTMESTGSMITIAAALRSMAAANPKFKQILLLSAAEEPLSVTVPALQKAIEEQRSSEQMLAAIAEAKSDEEE